MTNCTANVARGHQFAIAEYGSAVGATYTRRLACSRFALKGTTNTVTDDGIADSLWDQEGGEQIATEGVSGSVVLNPRAADLQAICRCIFGGAAFSTNAKLPGSICDYFQFGHSDPFVDKIYNYENCVTSRATFSASQGSPLLNLAWEIEAQSRSVDDDVAANWPSLTLSTQQPFVFRQGTLTIDGDTFLMRQFSLLVDNQLLAQDYFNALNRVEMPQDGQSFTLTHDSPWDLGTEAERIGTAQDIAASLDFVAGTKQIKFEFPRLFAVIDEPEIAKGARITNGYTWRAKHDPDNAIAAPVKITVVTS